MKELREYFKERLSLINIFTRSVVFNILFLGFPVFFIPFTALLTKIKKIDPMFYQKNYAKFTMWICKNIINLDFKVYGKENIPQDSNKYIIASKHQSAWDTQVFNFILPKVAVLFKKELEKIPFIKPVIKNSYLIPVDRKTNPASLRTMFKLCEKYSKEDVPILIFPEGTRVSPNSKAQYKSGVYAIYKKLNVPVIPVALNSGLFWGKREFIKYPGTIEVHFLTPIQPGFEKKEFMEILENIIEEKTKTICNKKIADR